MSAYCFPKGSILRPSTLRGVDDLKPADLYLGTNRIDHIFADNSAERTNGIFNSCLSEVPLDLLSLRCPGGLLSKADVSELLRDTVAVPRSVWTNHIEHIGGRYVFSLVNAKGEEFVIDERPGACALIFFPDATYRCVMNPNWESIKAMRK